MFENLSHLALQQYWWVLVSLLAALFVFLTFVQGGQTLIYSIGKTEGEKTIITQYTGTKMGIYIYHTCNFRRCLFCIVSFILFHKFWWRLLGLAGYSYCFCHSGSSI